MQSSPKVSVVITTYNSADFVLEAIQSVVDQSYRNHEIIVVDDGSSDNTSRFIEISNIPCRYIYQENRGAAAARNTGLKTARGQYINFLDADDLLFPDKLSSQVAYLDAHPEVDILYGDTEYFYEDGTMRSPRRFSRGLRTPPFPPSGNMLEALIINSVFAVHAALVRKTCLLKVGGFDECLRSAEDYDLWLRLATRCRFFYIDEVVCRYRIHGNNKVFSQPACRLNTLNQIWERVSQSSEFHQLPAGVKTEFFLRVATLNVLSSENPRKPRDAIHKAIVHSPKKVMPYIFLMFLLFGNKPLRLIIQLRRRLISNRLLWHA